MSCNSVSDIMGLSSFV